MVPRVLGVVQNQTLRTKKSRGTIKRPPQTSPSARGQELPQCPGSAMPSLRFSWGGDPRPPVPFQFRFNRSQSHEGGFQLGWVLTWSLLRSPYGGAWRVAGCGACGVWPVTCGVWGARCGMSGAGVWGVACGAWSDQPWTYLFWGATRGRGGRVYGALGTCPSMDAPPPTEIQTGGARTPVPRVGPRASHLTRPSPRSPTVGEGGESRDWPQRLVTDTPLRALGVAKGFVLLWGLHKLWNPQCQRQINKVQTSYLDVMISLETDDTEAEQRFTNAQQQEASELN